ncbi:MULTISPECIES: DUF7504 family protein [Haloferax]|uniref:Uncharacterized protein n=2 Tax=Haloferax gibbonsii TaxID=35746 RepID=A0A0K1IVU8_HALGI|nr:MULTISPECIES: hypothetical protein [Haloferax]AKU08418.1 hypothetical protein ABY42_11990 [Haloferax gibbonsii]ELZ80725.1 hypothetical protein C454_10481 [Haloferax gibbonsii ATCC 33959]QOS12432.1 uncharacterized protein HfgLR_11475 [Haloferax gibbonsii]RDZ52448.1 hypothetical protein C5C07_11740 [Haloferax sp. Atlit-4N]REA03620.1 hypothetical protein DEQ92_10925 [Haloferax sp. Atlit-6N]
MSLSTAEPFSAGDIAPDGIDSGTSILLVGDDSDALESVFYRLVAAEEDERSVVLATDDGGRSVRRALDRQVRGARSRSSVLAATGATGEGVEPISDLADLTKLGMSYSMLLSESQQETARFRSGIFLCSSICEAVDDVRSVYRLLNSNFLSELRRGEGIGVCALDTSSDIGASVQSVVAGMKTSFGVCIEVEATGRREATLTVSGLAGVDETLTVSI